MRSSAGGVCDPFYLSEAYLEENYPKKYLIGKVLDIVRAEPCVTKINMCGFNPIKKSEIFVWADVENDVRPQVKFTFDEEIFEDVLIKKPCWSLGVGC